MRRRNRLSINPKNIAIICGVLCIVLIVVSFKFEKEMAPVKTSVGSVFTPMQRGINSIGLFVTGKMKLINDIEKLLKENEKLHDEVESVRGENRLLRKDQTELDDLRELYKLDEKYEDLPKVGARIISKDPTNWYGTFTIDKGTNDGIKVNMNVIADDGLVGIVSETGHNYSKVRTIVDDRSNVTSIFLKSTEICNVSGDLVAFSKGRIRVDAIDKDVSVKDGEALYTSYDSPKFHPGILIGYVSDITVDSNNVTKSGYITPVVDFSSLEHVLIITELSKGLY